MDTYGACPVHTRVVTCSLNVHVFKIQFIQHTHTVRAMGLEKKKIKEDFQMIFKDDLKELTGGMMELVPGRAGDW